MTSLRIEESHMDEGGSGNGQQKEMELMAEEMPVRANTVGREPLLSTTVKHSVSLLDEMAHESHGPTAPGGAANEGDSLSKSEDT